MPQSLTTIQKRQLPERGRDQVEGSKLQRHNLCCCWPCTPAACAMTTLLGLELNVLFDNGKRGEERTGNSLLSYLEDLWVHEAERGLKM